MKILMTLILGLSLTSLAHAQSSTVNPGTSPTNSTSTTGDIAADTPVDDTASADVDASRKKKTFRQTVVEKSNNVKRAVKKGAHKISEMACRKDDEKCLALKEKHRAQEQAEYHRDKLSESQNVIQEIDSDTTP